MGTLSKKKKERVPIFPKEGTKALPSPAQFEKTLLRCCHPEEKLQGLRKGEEKLCRPGSSLNNKKKKKRDPG